MFAPFHIILTCCPCWPIDQQVIILSVNANGACGLLGPIIHYEVNANSIRFESSLPAELGCTLYLEAETSMLLPRDNFILPSVNEHHSTIQ